MLTPRSPREAGWPSKPRAPRTQILQGGRPTPFCNAYREELTAMSPRKVMLGAFAIDRTEVTVAEYRRCITAGMCSLDPLIALRGD